MRVLLKLFKFLCLFVVVLIFLSSNWLLTNYGNIKVDELLFYIFVPIKTAERGLINSFITKSLIPSLMISSILFVVLYCLVKEIKKHNFFEICIRIRSKILSFNIKKVTVLFLFRLVEVAIALSVVYISMNKLHVFEYIKEQRMSSPFIKDNYIDPRKSNIIFPDKKKNLIYIYTESLESTYFSKEYGGAMSDNLLEPITDLVKNNIYFSSTENFGGGALTLAATSYTSAALVAHTAGLPLKINGNEINSSYGHKSFLKGAYTLGEILEKENYNQMLMIGSDKQFGNRDVYFETHGNYEIYDLNTAKEKNKIPKDYHVWWGFEDGKLFEYAKEEITKLSKKEEPFNFTLLTANTHHVGGYTEESCEQKFNDNYANAIYCSAGQLNEFISWIKKQDFYNDTVIIIVGDHLSMDPNFFKEIDSNYQRTVFNLFINSSITTENTNNRVFTTMDMFPTTLASMGVKIDGDKLGLGTNLFSDKQTITEEYGFDYVNSEISKNSLFYNTEFVY